MTPLYRIALPSFRREAGCGWHLDSVIWDYDPSFTDPLFSGMLFPFFQHTIHAQHGSFLRSYSFCLHRSLNHGHPCLESYTIFTIWNMPGPSFTCIHWEVGFASLTLCSQIPIRYPRKLDISTALTCFSPRDQADRLRGLQAIFRSGCTTTLFISPSLSSGKLARLVNWTILTIPAILPTAKLPDVAAADPCGTPNFALTCLSSAC